MLQVLILVSVSLLISSIGFYKFIYFLSVGYGLAVAGLGLAMLVMFKMTLGEAILCLLLVIYGIRLGGFLLYRELRTGSYKKTFEEANASGDRMPLFVKVIMWLMVAILYVMQVSPIYFRLISQRQNVFTLVAGMIITVAGVLIESLADHQKSQAKAVAPHRFVDSGLYKIVRCPNYFGEIVFWTGVLVSGFGVLPLGELLIGLVGYLSIVYIMLGGARRLEIKQDARYGEDPDYRRYVSQTPVIFPGIPLYHLRPYTFLK